VLAACATSHARAAAWALLWPMRSSVRLLKSPNIAARVQTAAAPDTVLISAATHRLLSGCKNVGNENATAR